MPSTTYLFHKPKHPDKSVNDLIDEINSYYEAPKWFAAFYVYQEGGFLSSRITGDQLYYHLGDDEYQVIHSASCRKSIIAYLHGCLNFIDNKQ